MEHIFKTLFFLYKAESDKKIVGLQKYFESNWKKWHRGVEISDFLGNFFWVKWTNVYYLYTCRLYVIHYTHMWMKVYVFSLWKKRKPFCFFFFFVIWYKICQRARCPYSPKYIECQRKWKCLFTAEALSKQQPVIGTLGTF